MPDYSKGRIYTIRCRTNNKLIYVGCTTQPLSVRFAEHKRKNVTAISHYINNPENNTTWDDWYVELYENCNCNNKEELLKREGEVIREIATINKRGYYIDNKEYLKTYNAKNSDKIKQQKAEYREENRDEMNLKARETYAQDINKQKKAEYHIANIEHIKQRHKARREANRDEINRKQNEWYAANRDEINRRRREATRAKKEMNK